CHVCTGGSMSSVRDNVETRQLVLEVTQAEFEVIERAAELTRCSVNDFAVGWLRDAAMEVIDSRPDGRLTVEDTIALLEAMDNPPAPSEELRQAFRDYQEFVRERTT
ncbi:MAG TPA: DUF1778 domain-containing protein, partial [Thermomicrobiales bacterium]|nr:DUF1778 domain-containing protein [Thermomicrobiales bacterium]